MAGPVNPAHGLAYEKIKMVFDSISTDLHDHGLSAYIYKSS